MKKGRAIGWGLWVLYAFSLFCSFHFDWVSQYRDFFAVYFLSRFFCGMVLDLQEVKTERYSFVLPPTWQ